MVESDSTSVINMSTKSDYPRNTVPKRIKAWQHREWNLIFSHTQNVLTGWLIGASQELGDHLVQVPPRDLERLVFYDLAGASLTCYFLFLYQKNNNPKTDLKA